MPVEAKQSVAIISQNQVMRSILERIAQISASESTVLLIGETGVGKELFAEYIHYLSNRAKMPLVKVGLSALPQELLESELFGHDRGAYTSANAEKKGLFELANTGTIFLDDIDDFPLALQSKLLRVLEAREVKHVGGTQSIPLDVRLITATKVDLKTLVERNNFRADLYYRINVVPVVIPPLRERRDDIPFLIDHFLSRFAPAKKIRIAPEALQAMVDYRWPGNIRELRNIVQRISLFAKELIDVKDLPSEIQGHDSVNLLVKACQRCFTEEKMSFEQVMACLEVNLLQQTLQESGGNKSKAADKLQMSLSTLRDKLKKYDIEPR